MPTKKTDEEKKPKQGVIKTNSQGYNYKYSDLVAVNEYVEANGMRYWQEVETLSGDNHEPIDYIITHIEEKDKDGNFKEVRKCRGARIIYASLSGGKSNPAQEAGSGITYARRYSLYMALGLATEDDDAESLTTRPSGTGTTQTQGGYSLDFNAVRKSLKDAQTHDEVQAVITRLDTKYRWAMEKHYFDKDIEEAKRRVG